MININNLCKAYGDNIIFKNYSLRIEAGEMVIISGESGSGKTTLLNIIGALEPFDSGSITVDGLDVGDPKSLKDYFARYVGFIFQNFVLIDEMTVKQNLGLIKKTNASGMSIAEALERVGLSSKINSKVYTLSGGEQQRVALARLMIKKCSIILADEPTGSLDRRNSEHVLSILKSLNDEGKTVLLATHDESIINRGRRVISL